MCSARVAVVLKPYAGMRETPIMAVPEKNVIKVLFISLEVETLS